MASSAFQFDGAAGQQIKGVLETPETTPRGWAIFAHCFTCGKDSRAAVHISRALSRAGIGVLRFDFAGTGTGDTSTHPVNFAADVDDLRAAADAMALSGMDPTLLIGHSLGGSAAIVAAAGMPRVAAVATIGSPADLKHILHLFSDGDLRAIERDGESVVQIADRPFRVRGSFLHAVQATDLEAVIASLRRPLLVMHAPMDRAVGIENATQIFRAAKHPKSFISLDTADHLLTKTEDANYAAATVAAWASRYLPQLEEDLPQLKVAHGVEATETLAGKFQLTVRSGKHMLMSDEPESVGGLGSGLSPYELVSAGLAACTVMTMRLYADRKGFPLERATTRVEHEKIKDMTPPDRFTRIVSMEGPLNDEQRRRILEIADRCPVDLTLVRGSDVQTRLEGVLDAAPDQSSAA